MVGREDTAPSKSQVFSNQHRQPLSAQLMSVQAERPRAQETAQSKKIADRVAAKLLQDRDSDSAGFAVETRRSQKERRQVHGTALSSTQNVKRQGTQHSDAPVTEETPESQWKGFSWDELLNEWHEERQKEEDSPPSAVANKGGSATTDMQERREDAKRRTSEARRFHLGSAAVDKYDDGKGMPAMTEKEQQLRWILNIYEAASNNYHLDVIGLPMDVLLLLQFVCLTQIGQQRRIVAKEEATYPEGERWLRVLEGVFQEAFADIRKHPREELSLNGQGGMLLDALLTGCCLNIEVPLYVDGTQKSRNFNWDSDEKKQVRALLEVLEDVWRQNRFDCCDVTPLLTLLRRVCLETLEGDLEGGAEGDLRRRTQGRFAGRPYLQDWDGDAQEEAQWQGWSQRKGWSWDGWSWGGWQEEEDSPWEEECHRTADAYEQWGKDGARGLATVYEDDEEEGMPSTTEREKQIRWVLPIFEAAMDNYQLDPRGLPMDLLLLLHDVCLTQLSMQWLIATGDEEALPEDALHPKEERWLRVLLSVFEEALAQAATALREDLHLDCEGGVLLQALRDSCWASICHMQEEGQEERCQDNAEEQQVRTLLCVLDDVRARCCVRQCCLWGQSVKMLLDLLRGVCRDVLQ